MNKYILSHLARSLMILLLMLGLASADDTPRLQHIQHTLLSPASEQIALQLNGSYSPKVFTLKGESPRVVLDFAGMSQGRGVGNILRVNGPLIKTIRVGVHRGDAPKTRIVCDMRTLKGVTFTQQFDKETSILTIRFTGPEKTAATTAKTKEEAVPASAPKATKEAEPPAQKPASEKTVPPRQVTKEAGDTAAKPVEAKPEPPPAAEETVKEKATPSPEKAVQGQTAAQPQSQPAKPEPATKQVQAAKNDQVSEKQQEAKTSEAKAPAKPAKDSTPPSTKAAQKTSESKQTPVASSATEPSPEPEIVAVPESKDPELSSVKFDSTSPKGEMVMFKLNGFFPPSVHGVEEGIPRVICDFNNTKLTGTTKKRIKTKGKFVKTLRISKTRKPEKVRVIIDLEPNHSYDLQQVFFKDDNLFVIIVNTMKK